MAQAMLLAVLIPGLVAADLAGLAGVKTIGGTSYDNSTVYPGGPTARVYTTNETELWAYNVSAACASSASCAAQMTFLWTTGGKERHGRFIYDNVILRYYIDGQTEPDLEFFQGAGAGSFIHLESQQYYFTEFDPVTGAPGAPCPDHPVPANAPVTEQSPYCGMDLADSDTNDGTFQPWMNRWAGKNGAEGNWVSHFRVPFYKSIRITAQLNPARPAEIPANTSFNMFAVFRGVEGDDATLAAMTQLGGAALPPLKQYDVRLRLLKNTAYQSSHQEFVPLANISRWAPGAPAPAGPHAALNVTGGALFMTTVNFRPYAKGRYGLDWGGGCWWVLTDGAAALAPGKAMLVGTGIEDYFNSGFAFGFFAKTFHNSLSGLSHVHGTPGHGLKGPRPDWFTAYRYHDQDPLTFADGRFEFVWRNGESPTGLTCRPAGRATDNGAPVMIDSYVWVYTWSAPSR